MTIEIIGEQLVPIADLLCSPSFADRLKQPHVIALAESIRDTVLINPPMVRQSDGKVAAGEDRIAAHVILDREFVRATLIECDDDELEAIRKAENKHRRVELSAEELLARVEALGVAQAEPTTISFSTVLPDDSYPTRATLDAAREAMREGPGRPKERRTVAIEAVAEDTGRSADAVRKAVERAKAKREVTSIELWGTEQPAEWLEPVLAQRVSLTGASDKLRAAMAELTRMQKKSPIDDKVSWELHEALQARAHLIRSLRPACVCAWCKNRGDYVAECTACGGRGFLTEEQLVMVPEELKNPHVAMRDGVSVPLAQEAADPLADLFA